MKVVYLLYVFAKGDIEAILRPLLSEYAVEVKKDGNIPIVEIEPEFRYQWESQLAR